MSAVPANQDGMVVLRASFSKPTCFVGCAFVAGTTSVRSRGCAHAASPLIRKMLVEVCFEIVLWPLIACYTALNVNLHLPMPLDHF